MEDLISVIMSTYNESVSELRESIESVLKQTYSNIECKRQTTRLG